MTPTTPTYELADLEPGQAPTFHLALVDEDPALSDTQRRALHALARLLNESGSATDIAQVMGYRPPRSGRLAVTSALRALLDPATHLGASGFYVGRTVGDGQWATACWHLNHRLASRRDRQGRRCQKVWQDGQRIWVVVPEAAAPAATPALPTGKRLAAHRRLL